MIQLRTNRRSIGDLRFSPDQTTLAVPTYGGIVMWDLQSLGKKREVLPVVGNMLRFSPDGRSLFAAGEQITRVDMETRDSTTLFGFGGYSIHEISPDCTHVITSYYYGGHGSLSMRPLRVNAKPIWSFTTSQWPTPPQFLPDGTEFVWPMTRYIFARYDSRTGEQRMLQGSTHRQIERWTISPDGASIVCTYRHQIHVYNTDAVITKPHAVVSSGTARHLTDVVFHPSGRFLAATSNDTTVKLFETNTWKLVRTFTWQIGRMRSVSFSPDGSLAAASGGNGRVVVWDVDL